MFAIVDIETTGGSPVADKITEIAIYKFDGENIIDEFISLVNPERFIPYFITSLTGITNEMVAQAPKFFEIAKQIVSITEDCVFVAHNVNFDYNFIRNEFKQLGYDYKRKTLCTAKLSRKIIPGKRSYSLGNICAELDIEINGRHRAGGDAFATVHLFKHLLLTNPESFAQLTNFKLDKWWQHPFISSETIKKLPEETGVYFFYNQHNSLIYVGKSNNIRERVMQHFSSNNNRRQIEMCNAIADIETKITGSELIALLIESEEIKKNKPHYNKAQRRTLYNYGLYNVSTYDNDYIQLRIESTENNSEEPVISFSSHAEAIRYIEKLIDRFNLCQKYCGVYDTDAACFHHQINICRGACIGKESIMEYNIRVKKAIAFAKILEQNYYIIDKGRHAEENSVVKIVQGKLMGYGFYDNNTPISSPLQLDEFINNCTDNKDVRKIISGELKRNKRLKIIKF